ncbi:hypothetical protein AVEN_181801-1 [Araneus ventricosus]|uniref:Uncharacterized protein n=1 Tax=Araneus ventricosus TaxID=182803 RepID=A0A4Y2RT15_ARAVE|nr:hypothetical protein AVEN_181801-1 [Araneus ventricosus]
MDKTTPATEEPSQESLYELKRNSLCRVRSRKIRYCRKFRSVIKMFKDKKPTRLFALRIRRHDSTFFAWASGRFESCPRSNTHIWHIRAGEMPAEKLSLRSTCTHQNVPRRGVAFCGR